MKLQETIRGAHVSGVGLSYEKIIAYLMVEEGLSRRTAKEQIDCLINYGFCFRDGDVIKFNGESDIQDTALQAS